MAKDLGVWTAEDCALVLIDYSHKSSYVTGIDLLVDGGLKVW
jgi:hypothetical protein